MMSDNSWFDNRETPPIGTQCFWKGIRGGNWVACEIIDRYQDKEMVVFNIGTYRHHKFEILQLESVEFKPVLTEREHFGLTLWNVINFNDNMPDYEVLRSSRFDDYCRAYDAGFRLPESK